MDWYIPITILPGIGMMILSTSNLLIDLNKEIKKLNKEKLKFDLIITKKINQLKRLNYALINQYLAALLLAIGGIIGEIYQNENLIICIVFIGIIFLAISIILLIQYSIYSLKIRTQHLKS